MDGLPPPSAPVAPYVAPAPKSSQGLSSLSVYGLDGLKNQSKKGEEGKLDAIKKSSKQVEALFIQQAMKQFRTTGGVFKSDLFKSNAEDTYTQMLDGEMSQVLSERGLGLAERFEENLKLQSGIKPMPVPIPSRNMPGMKGSVQTELPKPEGKILYSTNRLDSVVNHITHKDRMAQQTAKKILVEEAPSVDEVHGDPDLALDTLIGGLTSARAPEIDLVDPELASDPLALPRDEQIELDFYSPLNDVISTKLLTN